MKKTVCLVLLRSLQGGSKFRCWFARTVCKYAFDAATRQLRMDVWCFRRGGDTGQRKHLPICERVRAWGSIDVAQFCNFVHICLEDARLKRIRHVWYWG